MEGYIHSLERCGTVDGPGLRFVVFLQGCNLRCRYCHNPDTWPLRGDRKMKALDLFELIQKYRTYFKASGGGLTVSGGEPLLQAEFVTELFRLCQAQGIHTALDTSGSVSPVEIEPLWEVTDLFLLDIKHLSPQGHLWLTKRETSYWPAWLAMLERKEKPYWIRQVLLPSLTDTPAYLEELARVLKDKNFCQRIELLPYHTLGREKCQALGLTYELEDRRDLGPEDVLRAKLILAEHGLTIE